MVKNREIQALTLEGGLPCLRFGEGPPVVLFPGFAPSNEPPEGRQRALTVRWLSPVSRRHTVNVMTREAALNAGRDPNAMEITFASAPDTSIVGRLADLGIDRLTVGFPGTTLDDRPRAIETFAEIVMPAVGRAS